MRTTLLEKQEYSGFTYDSNFNAYVLNAQPALFTLEVGQTYEVDWDGEVATCTAYENSALGYPIVCIGDGTQLGGPSMDVSFLIVYTPSANYLSVFTDSAASSHNIGVYQITEDESSNDTETAKGANIVLRDRNGREVQYPNVSYIKVNTVEGGTQGFAAYDPETLKAENLPVGVTVGDVDGALEVPQLLENVPVALDFTNGDMEITAPDGYALKSGIVQKPANLTPANIAKDVDIAGIVGELEAGGGDVIVPAIYVAHGDIGVTAATSRNTSSGADQLTTVRAPLGCTVLWAFYDYTYNAYSSASSHRYCSVTPASINPADVSCGTTYDTYQKMQVYKYESMSTGYPIYGSVLTIGYTLPGVFFRITPDGIYTAYADESVANYYAYKSISFAAPVHAVDFSESKITTVMSYAFYNLHELRSISFPATVTSIEATAIGNCPLLEIVDFSRCTAVPTLASSTAFTTNTNLQIKVPAALYDSWKAATNWSSLASYIVAV